MKNFKKFTATIAATLMAASLSVPMFASVPVGAAATENTISFTGEIANSGHTYTAYRIFDGTVKITPANESTGTPAKTELTGIKWANEAKADVFLTALKGDTTIGNDFASCSNAVEVANVLSGYTSNGDKAKAFAKLVVAQKDNLVTVNDTASGTITADKDGYYVVVESPLTGVPLDSAMTSYLLAVYDASEGAEIAVKSAIPTVEKKIQENAKTGDWQADATYGERYNDTADFNIGDTVPFKLFGTMPSNIAEYPSYKYVFHDTLGKEFTLAENFATKGVTVSIDGTVIDTSKYSVTVVTDAGTKASNITITFDDIKTAATLSATSKVVVSYSATLNDSAAIGKPGQENAVYLEYSNNPNVGGTGTTSKTNVDEVIAFTYELDVTKVDGANEDLKLKDAEFKLQATNGTHKDMWAIVDSNGKVSNWTADEEQASVLTSATDGTFKVIGLDDGAYSLKETKAPNGYNLLTEAVVFTINANTSNTQTDSDITGDELTALTIQVGSDTPAAGNLVNGSVNMTVKNNSGTGLPSTGGIGTTLFYIGGGCMVGLAGIFLITKKRMGKKDE